MSKVGPVLIIAPPGDVHALVVAARIESRSHEVVIWDSARLPATDQLSLYLTKGGQRRVILESTACGTIDLSQVQSIWWRRPSAPTIPSGVVGDYMRAYCRSEMDQFFQGVLAGLAVPVHNEPDAEETASRKPYQLLVASELGLMVPETLLTCSPAKAIEFCETSKKQTVIKPFRTPAGSLCSTQLYEEGLSDKLSLLRNAPGIFQERLDSHKDVRVSVIGKKIFAAVSNTTLLDWRVDGTLTWAAHQLPPSIERLVLLLLEKLGLTLGHLDFRLTAENEYIFFEINPSGQFLFLELDDHQIEVTSALADLLIGLNESSNMTESHTP
jgi:hypothetical protein